MSWAFSGEPRAEEGAWKAERDSPCLALSCEQGRASLGTMSGCPGGTLGTTRGAA